MIAKTQLCNACEKAQELPAIFCSSCGEPLLKISKWFMSILLSVTVAAYVTFGIYGEKLLWPAPLYLYYVFLFVVFSYTVTRRHGLLTFRMIAWSLLLLYAMWFFWLSLSAGIKMVTSDVRDYLDIIDKTIAGQFVLVGFAVVILILGFAALWRRFGLVIAYRVFLTIVAAAAFAARWAFAYSIGETGAPVSPRLSDWFTWAPETTVKEMFELIAVNTIRVIVAEIAVYSFVKSYKAGEEHYRRLVGAGHVEAMSGRKSPLGNTITLFGNFVLRTSIMLQHFAISFVKNFSTYVWAVYRVVRRLFLDLVLPLLSLLAIAMLLAMIAEHSGAYISGHAPATLIYFDPIRSNWLMIIVCTVLVFLAQMVFLASITKFPMVALSRCNVLLVMWIAPFFFAFFVFVSISLVVTGTVLRRWNAPFPYRIGPFTIVAAAVLVLLIAYAVFHNLRRRPPIAAVAPAELDQVAAEESDQSAHV